MENIYVAGGIYYKNSDPKTGEFKLVHPTGQHPYITHKMEGVNGTSHHSHVYRLNEDRKTVTLVKEQCVGVGAPHLAMLSPGDQAGVAAAIAKGKFYDR